MKNKRINIALFTSHLEDNYAKTICKGAMIGAKETDSNLFIIPGRYFDSNYEDKERTQYQYQYDTLFSYVNSHNVDVLIIMMETIGSTWSYERKTELLSRFGDLPVINIGPDIDDYCCVKFDNKTGLRDGIEHIIKNHNRKKIGFVSGPLTNKDAVERLQVYRDTMAANNMPVDENLISYGYFSDYSIEATEEILDKNPDIDAIVFSNDKMAMGGYQVMAGRGIKIGEDISVMGFDDDQSAVTLSPKLTTVRADAAEIGYKSVIEAVNLIKYGEMKNPVIDSRLIIRGSCGCKNKNFNIADNNEMEKIFAIEQNKLSEYITDFVFENYKSSLPADEYRYNVFRFFDTMIRHIAEHDISDDDISDIPEILNYLIESNMNEYVSIDKLFCALDIIYRYTIFSSRYYSSTEQRLELGEFFTGIYCQIAEKFAVENMLHTRDIEYLSWMTNSLTRDMLIFVGDDKSFGTVCEKLSGLKMKSSYIMTFEEPIVHTRNQKWIPPEKIYLKAYNNLHETRIIPEDKQLIDTNDIFCNDFLPDNRRYTMVLSALYSNENQYGLLLCELDYEYFYYIAPVTVQLCAAMKTMHLIKQQEIIQQQLKESLEKIKQNNIVLDNISKSDELTGIYNRRGFFEMAQSIMTSPENESKRAIVVFADLDCLKVINDKFGHDEGDYAIRKTAEILSCSFRNTDIVGRIGGDEFSAFALVECNNYANAVRERIKNKSDELNSLSDKPYYIGLSIGICEFECSPGINIKEVLDIADEQLYAEKRIKNKKIFKYEN